MVVISPIKVELTHSAHMELVEEFFVKQNLTLYKAYEEIEGITNKRGFSSRYSTFDSFKNAWYDHAKKCREISKNRKKS